MRFLILLLVASSALAAEVRRFEATPVSGGVQVNGALTQHAGVGAGFAWYPHPRLGVRLFGAWNVVARESAFNDALAEGVRYETPAAQKLLNPWNAVVAVEGIPLQGDLHRLMHIAFVLFGGGGVGGTKHALKPENASGPATYGDAGLRPMAALGAGFRLLVAERFTVRFDVRDLMVNAGTKEVNGCNAADLTELARRQDLDVRPDGPLRAGCSAKDFGSQSDIPLARNLVSAPGNPLLHNVGVQLGFGFLF